MNSIFFIHRCGLPLLLLILTCLALIMITITPETGVAALTCRENIGEIVDLDIEAMSIEEHLQKQDELQSAYEEAKRSEILARSRVQAYVEYIEALRGEEQDRESVELQIELEEMKQSAEVLACFHYQNARVNEIRLEKLDAAWRPPTFKEEGKYTIPFLPPLPGATTEKSAGERLEDIFAEETKTLRLDIQRQRQEFDSFLGSSTQLATATNEMKKNRSELWKEVDRSYEMLISELKAMGLPTATVTPPKGYKDRN